MPKVSLSVFITACIFKLLAPSMVHAQNKIVIEWSNCSQPDLSSDAYTKAVDQSIDKHLQQAKAKYPSDHIALRLNKMYGIMVQERRNLVSLNYIPIGSQRTESQCALSTDNYRKLIVLRDTSYYFLCRSEVAIGTSSTERTSKDLQTLAAAAIYDLLKSLGADLRAKKAEPTTPPGGYAACKRGATDALNDQFPSAADAQSFKTRLSFSSEERAQIGDPTKQ